MRESPKAKQAWADYLGLGEGRSLEKLVALYRTCTGSVPPTRQIVTLKVWSTRHGWQARLRTIADQAAAEAEAAIVTRRREALESGLALDYERVLALKRRAERLLVELDAWEQPGEGGEPPPLWLSKPAAYGVALDQLRGLLDDIAKEKSERVKAVKVDVEQRVRRIALRLGLDPDEAVAVVQGA